MVHVLEDVTRPTSFNFVEENHNSVKLLGKWLSYANLLLNESLNTIGYLRNGSKQIKSFAFNEKIFHSVVVFLGCFNKKTSFLDGINIICWQLIQTSKQDFLATILTLFFLAMKTGYNVLSHTGQPSVPQK